MQAARPPITQQSSKGGMLSFFTPRKKKDKGQDSSPSSPVTQSESIGKYIKQDGSLGRAFISFKDIVSHCDTKLFETAYPLIGQWSDGPSRPVSVSGVPVPKTTTQPIGEIILQVFRLPALPDIPPAELPQSLEECHRGLRHVAWHKVTYHQGVLTQNGGDCRVSRSSTCTIDVVILRYFGRYGAVDNFELSVPI